MQKVRYRPLVVFVLLSSGWAETIDLLDSSDRWERVDTSSEVFQFGPGEISAARRSYQSATIITNEEFENFDLEFEFLVHRWCELVMLIHAPWNGAWGTGIELLLSDHFGDAATPYTAGAVLGRVAGKQMTVKKNDEWNSCMIHCDWPRFEVTINGTVVQELDLSASPEFRDILRRGRIGFRDLLGWGFQVRDMRLTELPDSENGVHLFNGKDLSGWKRVRPGEETWTVHDEAIVARNGNGYLQHAMPVQDFDLRLYYRTSPTANGGVFFRWRADDSDRGNEIQILDVPQSNMPSASIYSMVRARDDAIRPVGQWQLLQIRVEGPHCVTHLNGIKTAETDALTKVWPGHITLQMHKENSSVEFKDLVLVLLDR